MTITTLRRGAANAALQPAAKPADHEVLRELEPAALPAEHREAPEQRRPILAVRPVGVGGHITGELGEPRPLSEGPGIRSLLELSFC